MGSVTLGGFAASYSSSLKPASAGAAAEKSVSIIARHRRKVGGKAGKSEIGKATTAAGQRLSQSSADTDHAEGFVVVKIGVSGFSGWARFSDTR